MKLPTRVQPVVSLGDRISALCRVMSEHVTNLCLRRSAPVNPVLLEARQSFKENKPIKEIAFWLADLGNTENDRFDARTDEILRTAISLLHETEAERLKSRVVHNALLAMLDDRETVPEDTVELAGAALQELYDVRAKLRTYEEQQPSVQLLRGELRKLAVCMLNSMGYLEHTCRSASTCAACERRRKLIELAGRWQ